MLSCAVRAAVEALGLDGWPRGSLIEIFGSNAVEKGVVQPWAVPANRRNPLLKHIVYSAQRSADLAGRHLRGRINHAA